MNIFGHAERKIIPEPKTISINNEKNYTEYYDERIGKNYKISNLSYPNTKINPEELNNDFTIYEDTGFIFGDYAEFMLEYDFEDTSNIIEEMDNFNIGTVIIKVQEPTPLLAKALCLESDKYFIPEYLTSISFKGVNKENVETYLQQALFLIGNYSPSDMTIEYPKVKRFLGEDIYTYYAEPEELQQGIINSDNTEIKTKIFSELKYTEVLSFYNKGMSMKEEQLGFLYFYKVIEYFFLINRKDDFINNINVYNKNGDIDSFIEKVTKIYYKNEKEHLKLVLKSIENYLKPILKSAKESKKIVDENNTSEFSNALYEYRNSIAHGKSDTNFFLKLPSPLSLSDTRFWNNTVLEISKILIEKYCFPKTNES